ncbi:cytochrome b561 and DOMON domain-containing protein At5g35735 [Jatropha curcas]|uniref:cytochrome b561 and DOMON domain-containing protein At5g35735 n=1 Tax=Jatropha curcas TaxID=180498 RepID=UPI0005FABEC7|nr:cytochrome b561 and DOMON domain-containing protein At5g35735 [Jatropha curcas]
MTSHCLVILTISLIFPLPSLASNGKLEVSTVETNEWQTGVKAKTIKNENGVETSNYLGSWKVHHRHHFRNAHGILNMIGWGAFLPIGVIVARYFSKAPLKCDEWYNLHILCQTSGYIIGAIGWGVGLWLGTSSKQQSTSFKTHRILGIIIFTLATLQILALCLQPKREGDYRRYWQIYHHLTGYALLAMIIANIFEGIRNQAHSERWKWIYVGILVILGFLAFLLEILRWVKPKIHHRMAFHINI